MGQGDRELGGNKGMMEIAKERRRRGGGLGDREIRSLEGEKGMMERGRERR
jgi:hypothetical protein